MVGMAPAAQVEFFRRVSYVNRSNMGKQVLISLSQVRAIQLCLPLHYQTNSTPIYKSDRRKTRIHFHAPALEETPAQSRHQFGGPPSRNNPIVTSHQKAKQMFKFTRAQAQAQNAHQVPRSPPKRRLPVVPRMRHTDTPLSAWSKPNNPCRIRGRRCPVYGRLPAAEHATVPEVSQQSIPRANTN